MHVQLNQVFKDNEKLTTEYAKLQTALQKERKEAQTRVNI